MVLDARTERPGLMTWLLSGFGTAALLGLVLMVTLLDSTEFRTSFLTIGGYALLLIGAAFLRDRHWSLGVPIPLVGIYFLATAVSIEPDLALVALADLVLLSALIFFIWKERRR